LLAFSLFPKISQAARLIPQSVIVGLQVGLGVTLGVVAFGMMRQDWMLALPTLALLSLSYVWRRGPWAVLAVGGGITAGLLGGAAAPEPLLSVASSSTPEPGRIILSGIIPQLPLTLLNAVVLTAALARSLYGPKAARVSERKLAATSGILNLALAPFGAIPMCHGAGGLTAHHRFGARGIGAPLVMAALCGGAALLGPRVLDLLAAIPLPVIGALLAYASADLAFSRRLIDARADCRPVIAAAAVATFILGAAAGLVAGVGAEAIRLQLKKRAVA
jgi:MFS superfamily sulfate permease-like transporter